MRHSNHFLLMCLAAILSAAIISYPSYQTYAAAPQVFSAKKINDKCKKKNSFAVGDEIWAKGKGLAKNKDVDIYIVEQDDRCLWRFGDPLVDASGGTETVTTNSKGKFGCEKIWNSALEGNYDIIADVDQNGEYSSGDAVDSIVVGTGLSVSDTEPATVDPLGLTDLDGDGTPETACLARQYFFLQLDDVYATGEGFPPGTNVDIYVKTNQGWNFGDSIGSDDGDGKETVTTTVDDPNTTDEDEGGVLPCTMIWDHTATALPPGEAFDIVVDVNQDGKYNNGGIGDGDTINDRCFEAVLDPGDEFIGAGFRVESTTTTTTTTTTTSTTSTTTTSTTTTTI